MPLSKHLAGVEIARAKETDGRAPNALLVEVLDVAASLGAPALARTLAWCGGAPPDTALAGDAAPDDGEPVPLPPYEACWQGF